MSELIAQGAESRIFVQDDIIVKERFARDYRHPAIDNQLRKSRTRREAKVMQKLMELELPVPQLIEMDDEEMTLHMGLLKGTKLRDCIEEDIDGYAKQVGALIARMHNAGIIHGDLTTSNMVVVEGVVHLIDFGLSFFSEKEEDKAVDLHLLKHAIESKHSQICSSAFSNALHGYATLAKDYDVILRRLEIVESRGRNKVKQENKE